MRKWRWRTKVDSICEAANVHIEAKRWAAAGKLLWDAFDLIPEPRERYAETTWVVASIGDVLLGEREWDKARQAFEDAIGLPGGLGNPYLHMRLGQAEYEVGNLGRASEELMRAYMGAGDELFRDEDPKYLSLVAGSARSVKDEL
jgi:tetratricopeptide (TPR) repeat protein